MVVINLPVKGLSNTNLKIPKYTIILLVSHYIANTSYNLLRLRLLTWYSLTFVLPTMRVWPTVAMKPSTWTPSSLQYKYTHIISLVYLQHRSRPDNTIPNTTKD